MTLQERGAMLPHVALGPTCFDQAGAPGASAQAAERCRMVPSGKLLTTCIRSARITHNYAFMEVSIVKKRLAEAPQWDACQHFGATDAAALPGDI
jgi:hypothetical protein